jgi:2-alkyl-3-oxoalkanoate reductase
MPIQERHTPMSDPHITLVTGATGSIGSALVQRLSAAGQRVRAVARNPERSDALRSLPNVEIVPGDLSRPESLRGIANGCSVVYHCAAKLNGTNRAEFDAVNITGTQAVVDEVIRVGVERLVYASTIGVYGFADAQNITEEYSWPPCRLPYVVTKREAERRVQAAADRIPVTIARFGDVIGPGQYTWTISLIEKINMGLLKPPLDSVSGNLNTVYIDNLLDALLLMSTYPAAVGQVFNLVDGIPIRVSDYIRRLAQMAGKRPFAVPAFALRGAAAFLMWKDQLRGREASVTPGDISYLLHKATISNQKIRTRLGWTAAVDPQEAFRRTEQWLRDAGYLKT